ncbi:uncharacterized protein LOC126266264 [Aethina tumida]|uniref:uncharacterized protein LOC126266264 n=1 Tax=Aethina tumida TaxID=116153 RepID=UPI002147A171|nr:uncharacterized protein LOC126266264 [Aethina tumida]
MYAFEKYIVLASGVFLIAPFTLSNVLILGIFHKNVRIIYIWVKINLGTNSVLVGCMLAAGIYIIVEGTLYVGCSLVGVSLILAGFAGYFTYMGLKIIEEIRTMENSERDETVNSSSSDTSTESA